MKKWKRLIAAASALVLSLCTVPVSAGAARIDTIAPEAVTAEAPMTYTYFETVEDAGLYVREQMKKHTPELHIRLAASSGSKDILNDVLGVAFAETGRGDEGEYLRLAIEGYSSGSNYYRRDQILDILFYYNSTLEEEAAVAEKIDSIIASLDVDGKDEYEKIKAVYDYFITNVDYSEEFDRSEIYTAYGALVENDAVCQGYIQAMYRILTDIGISCRAVMGEGNGGDHVWCKAGIDGTYYFLDPTWDSEYNGKVKLFFLKGTEDLDEYSYPVVHIAGSGDPNNYAFVPDCTSESYLTQYPEALHAFDVKAYYSDFLAGDLNYDGCIDVFDLIAAKKGLINGFTNKRMSNAADVNGDGEANISDAVLIQRFIEGSIADFSNAS